MPPSERLSPVVYRVTETDFDGASFCHVRGWDAMAAGHMVNRMIRLADEQIARGNEPGLLVDPATDATGRLVLRRRHLSFGKSEGQVCERWRTWELEPVTRPKLSEQQAECLEAVAKSRHWPGEDFSRPQVRGGTLRTVQARATTEMRVLCSGMYSIPPASWRRLVEKGWIHLLSGEVKPMEPVRLTVAGTVALALREHQTSTSSPVGYVRRAGGRMYDGSSAVVCSAGCFRGRFLDRRNLAAAEARAHRAEAVLLALGASKEQAQRAARRAQSTPGGAVAA
ncbi:hypothetical protein [Streptomyces violaceusniger]|uniref:Uncharacterized protein n=1 Tax=Streptomyces violaceusniger (strain Tu 4113) TaxID=653045 RepID=G2PHR0_STRV4|nr:hypothetical protein [Streptomyces violaceusniger]AEM88861.1 hypothetical protein Strvi_0085 [Streptomyces violaceusniger Tu 4113]